MNNNLKYIGLLSIIILFGIFSLPKIYERVINSDITDSNRLHSNDRLSYLTISDEKRKAPDFILTNQDSIFISNEDMRGKVYVLEFFFTRCPDICIEMNQNMKLLDDKFAETDEFGIISVTIDPKNDTPSILKKYSEALEVKSQNWHFLTGEKEYIYDLANNAIPAQAKNYANNGKCKVLNHEYMIGSFSPIYMSRNRVRPWNKVSFTIQAGGRHAPIHPQAPEMVHVGKNKKIFKKGSESLYRRLSVRECARIQTFPDDYEFIYDNVTDGYKMIGNAVPVDFAQILANQLKLVLE